MYQNESRSKSELSNSSQPPMHWLGCLRAVCSPAQGGSRTIPHCSAAGAKTRSRKGRAVWWGQRPQRRRPRTKLKETHWSFARHSAAHASAEETVTGVIKSALAAYMFSYGGRKPAGGCAEASAALPTNRSHHQTDLRHPPHHATKRVRTWEGEGTGSSAPLDVSTGTGTL
jgi:hypothetical protein